MNTCTVSRRSRFCLCRCGSGRPFNLFATTGFLPTEFRLHMQLPGPAAHQRRFEWLLTALRVADRVIPRDVWILGYQLYLWDMRSRARRGKRVV